MDGCRAVLQAGKRSESRASRLGRLPRRNRHPPTPPPPPLRHHKPAPHPDDDSHPDDLRLAATLSPSQTRRAFREAAKSSLLNRPRLHQLVESSPTHRGNATLKVLLAATLLPLSETRSWLEDLLVTICADNGLPLPAINVPLLGCEADFLWPAARFVVEVDGGDHLDPLQRDKDNTRDIARGRAGYLVRRYSSRAMEDEAVVASEVVSILRERGNATAQLRY